MERVKANCHGDIPIFEMEIEIDVLQIGFSVMLFTMQKSELYIREETEENSRIVEEFSWASTNFGV